jgi:hypothetical protein
MPTASQTHARIPERLRRALRTLLAAFLAAPPYPAFNPWHAAWLSFTLGRRR